MSFSEQADKFSEVVNAAELTSTSEVILVYHCRDVHGSILDPIRVPLTPTITISGMQATAALREVALEMLRGTIIQNIDSLVRHAPTGTTMINGGPRVPMTIDYFEIEFR